MRSSRRLPLIAVILAGPGSLAAQPASPAVVPAAHFCFRGRPRPACHAFMLTEAGIAVSVTGTTSADGPLLTWELGAMRNGRGTTAFGVAVFAQAAGVPEAVGVRPRVRVWLAPNRSVDLAAGITFIGSQDFSAVAALNFADYAALTAHLTSPLQSSYGQTTSVFLGGRLGSWPGSIVGVASPLIGLIGLLIAFSGDS